MTGASSDPTSAADIRLISRTRVRPIAGKGYGIVAAEPIEAGAIVEENLCLVLDAADTAKVGETRLAHYVYFWSDEGGVDQHAVAIGNLSFCNHASRPNASIVLDPARGVVALRAKGPVEAGTEITVDYEYPLDFTVQE